MHVHVALDEKRRLVVSDTVDTTPMFSLGIDPLGPGLCKVTSWSSYDALGTSRRSEESEIPKRVSKQLEILQEALLLDRKNVRRASFEGDPPAIDVQAMRGAAPERAGGAAATRRLIREFGTVLFEILFQGAVKQSYLDTVKRADNQSGGGGLRLRLLINGRLKVALPWEALYDPDKGYFICARNDLYAARAHDEDLDAGLVLEPGSPPVSVLAMAARARSVGSIQLSELDATAERLAIETAFKPLIERQAVELVWTEAGDPGSLMRRLRRPPNGIAWSVFHFIGHGGVGDLDGDGQRVGYVVMDDEDSFDGMLVSATQLSAWLAGPRRPRLVVLNCCRSAGLEPDGRFANAAATLIRNGMHAVIAMQFEISDHAAIYFSKRLYGYLAAGEGLLSAVTLARMSLQQISPEWITPVLFMRARDGSLVRAAGGAAL